MKPLISQPHIKCFVFYDPVNCTCETFRDFIQMARKQSLDYIDYSKSCFTLAQNVDGSVVKRAIDSLLSGYRLLYYCGITTTRQNRLQAILDYDRDNMNCTTVGKQPEVKTKLTEVTTSHPQVTTEEPGELSSDFAKNYSNLVP